MLKMLEIVCLMRIVLCCARAMGKSIQYPYIAIGSEDK